MGFRQPFVLPDVTRLALLTQRGTNGERRIVLANRWCESRILLIGQGPAGVWQLERILRREGFASVDTTFDPAQARTLHFRTFYDLVILDLSLPGAEPFALLEELKEAEQLGVRSILVIADTPEERARALRMGARDYSSRPLEAATVLARVQNTLELRSLYLDTRKLYEQIVEEQKTADALLLNLLPYPVAKRLKAGSQDIVDSFSVVTVVFADIVNFMSLSERSTPSDLITLLNQLFSLFDEVAEKWGVEKIKTIGDAYMAVSGLPWEDPDHAERAANAALDMLEAVDQLNETLAQSIQVRIGLHSGPVVAGVIGKRKFSYDLWGDTVNLANRMESHGIASRAQMTAATRELLGDLFEVEERGMIEVKGRGATRTWILKGRCGATASTAPFRSSSGLEYTRVPQGLPQN